MGKKSRRSGKRKELYFDYSLLFLIIFIAGFGLMMIYSTSSYTSQMDYGNAEHYFIRQLMFDLLGFAGMLFFYFFDYHKLQRIAPVIFALAIISLLLIIPFGKVVKGAKRWIPLGPINFQPAEFAKLAVIIMGAAAVCTVGSKIKKFRYVMLICVVIAGTLSAMILFITNNLSSAIIVFGIEVIITFVAYPGYKIYVIITSFFVAAFAAFYSWLVSKVKSGTMTDSFRLNRFLVWLNPENYMSGKGYQTVQGLYAIGSGGLFGKGLGKSLQKLGFIPESQNDMIFSIICEELGLFGAICIILVFMLMLWRIIHIAQNAPDLFGTLLATGVFAHIAIQVVLNIAVVTNFIPNTGVSLPFISYGGSATLFLMIEMGIVLNVSSQIRLER